MMPVNGRLAEGPAGEQMKSLFAKIVVCRMRDTGPWCSSILSFLLCEHWKHLRCPFSEREGSLNAAFVEGFSLTLG
jgi:hypothetical protein